MNISIINCFGTIEESAFDEINKFLKSKYSKSYPTTVYKTINSFLNTIKNSDSKITTFEEYKLLQKYDLPNYTDIEVKTFDKYKSRFQYIFLVMNRSYYDRKRFEDDKKQIVENINFPHVFRTIILDQINLESLQDKIGYPKYLKEQFLKEYLSQIDRDLNFDSIVKQMKQCPLCHTQVLKVSHDYTKESCQDINLLFQCTKCNEILMTKNLCSHGSRMMDASYIYNDTIKKYADEYIQSYLKSIDIISKIDEEFDKTETYGYLGCQ